MDIGTILTGIGAFGVVTGNGMIIRFLWSRQNLQSKKFETQDKKFAAMETARKKELYQDDGQTNYVLRKEHNAHCKEIQEAFCKKVDEVKDLLQVMDKKREDAKDEYHLGILVLTKSIGNLSAQIVKGK